jgi:hypothetical protein
MCWYCHWGWPRPVADIYIKAVREIGDYGPMHYGPGHVVWNDENFDSAQWCLATFERYSGNYSPDDLLIVRRSLEELAALPQSAWDIEPPEYDGMNPQDYPPTVEVAKCSYNVEGVAM